MKLTYFVGPYDLLNHKTQRPTPMTIEGISADYDVLSMLQCCLNNKRTRIVPQGHNFTGSGRFCMILFI